VAEDRDAVDGDVDLVGVEGADVLGHGSQLGEDAPPVGIGPGDGALEEVGGADGAGRGLGGLLADGAGDGDGDVVGVALQPTIDMAASYWWLIALVMMALGACIGVISSLVATRRYLKSSIVADGKLVKLNDAPR